MDIHIYIDEVENGSIINITVGIARTVYVVEKNRYSNFRDRLVNIVAEKYDEAIKSLDRKAETESRSRDTWPNSF